MTLSVLDAAGLVGTFFFAASGARLGVHKGFDLLGVLVLGCVTAVGGGSVRDVLLGHTPPVWFREERLLWAAMAGSLAAFLFYRRLPRSHPALDLLDAAGLALFSSIAAHQGATRGLGPLGIVFIGTVSGVGGGVIRDLLVQEIPRIFLPGELYASTAALGSLVVVFADPRLPGDVVLALGAAVTFLARLLAVRYHLRLPVRTLAERKELE